MEASLFTVHLWLFQHRWVQSLLIQVQTDKYRLCWHYPWKQKEKKMLIKASLNNISWLISAAALGKYMKAYKIKTRLDICLVKIHKACLTTLLLMWNILDLALQGQILLKFMAMQFHRHYQFSFVLQKNFIHSEFGKKLQVKISIFNASVLTQVTYWFSP